LTEDCWKVAVDSAVGDWETEEEWMVGVARLAAEGWEVVVDSAVDSVGDLVVEVSVVVAWAAEASVVANLAAEGWEVVVDSAVGAKTENTP
jgi:hypothetical protein